MGNALVAMRSDPLEQVADFQKQPPTLQPLADTTEGTVLASQRPAPSATLQHTVTQLQSEFSGELGVTAPSPHSAARPGASAAVYLPRGDSAARGLVEDSGTGGKSYVVVQVPAAPSFPLAIASSRGRLTQLPFADAAQNSNQGDTKPPERLYFATCRGSPPDTAATPA
jgi:hypothetical protein